MKKIFFLIFALSVVIAALAVVFLGNDPVKYEGVVVDVRDGEIVARERTGKEFVSALLAETKYSGTLGEEIAVSRIREGDWIEVVGKENKQTVKAMRIAVLDTEDESVITKYDDGDAFIYPIASRFTIVVRGQGAVDILCDPESVLGSVESRTVPEGMLTELYETVESGTCTVTFPGGEKVHVVSADTDDERAAINFLESGVVVNAGGGAYRFVYEAPGAPALTKDVKFSSPSLCYVEGAKTDCARLILKDGTAVVLAGVVNGQGVDVAVLKTRDGEIEDARNTIKLYYYDPKKDQDSSGNILCSRSGLAGVVREVPQDITPRAAVELLLKGELTAAEKNSGIQTEYPLAGFKLTNSELKGDTLTLTFEDPQNKTQGGSCRVSVLWYQIEATARQFPGIQNVEAKPETLFQP